VHHSTSFFSATYNSWPRANMAAGRLPLLHSCQMAWGSGAGWRGGGGKCRRFSGLRRLGGEPISSSLREGTVSTHLSASRLERDLGR